MFLSSDCRDIISAIAETSTRPPVASTQERRAARWDAITEYRRDQRRIRALSLASTSGESAEQMLSKTEETLARASRERDSDLRRITSTLSEEGLADL